MQIYRTNKQSYEWSLVCPLRRLSHAGRTREVGGDHHPPGVDFSACSSGPPLRSSHSGKRECRSARVGHHALLPPRVDGPVDARVAGTQKRARRCRSRFQVAFSPGNAFLLPATSTRTLSPPMASLADFILSYVPLPSTPYYLTQYVPGKTPLSTPQEVFPTLVAYLVIIFTTQWFMKDRAALKLRIPFQIHNVFLSSGSLLLMTLILEEVIPMVWKNGVFWGMCSTDMWTSVRLSRVVSCTVWTTDLRGRICSTSSSTTWSTTTSSTSSSSTPSSLL